MKNIILTIFLMTTLGALSQTTLNDYKYIIVPKKFDTFKNENQYSTSTTIKYLFTQKGFSVVYDDSLPEDLSANRCLGLFVDLIDNSSMFTTKTALSLKDCNQKEIFLTQEGRSKVKEFKEAFTESIKNAFNSFSTVNYTYNSKFEPKDKDEAPVTVSFKNDVKTLEDTPNDVNKDDAMVEQITTEDVQYYKDRRPIETDIRKADSSTDDIVEAQVATKEEQSFKSMEPVQSDLEKSDPAGMIKKSMGFLYAQELPNGYQLVDSTPKIQLKIYKSSMPNVYIARADDKDGLVYISDGKWFFEYHQNDEVILEELNIKF